MQRTIVILDGQAAAPTVPGDQPPAGEPTWDRLGQSGQLQFHPRTPEDQVAQRIGDAAIAITNKAKLGADVFEACPDLEYVGVTATGVNVVDLGAARQAGVTVTNAPGYAGPSVAQHAIALLVELASRVGVHHRAVHCGQWVASEDFAFTVWPLTELSGKTLGIVGMGSIGQRTATIGAAMGMRVAAAHQRSENQVSLPGVEIHWQDHEQLFAEADAISLHCPLTAQTEGLVSRQRLSSMKRGAFLINTGRGQLIDESALAQALEEGEIAGAGLDVLSVEPPHSDNPLLAAPNCVITPHCAWMSREARRRLMEIVCGNLEAWLGDTPVNVVNP